MTPATTTLWLKLLLVPLLISAASLAGRRWGPQVGGWLVGLPLTSGPVIVFLALEQGTAFAARSAQGTLLGLISVTLFCLTYAWLASRAPWYLCTLAGWAAYVLSTAGLTAVSIGLFTSSAAVVAAMAMSLRLLPETRFQGGRVRLPAWDIPLRILAATTLVLTLTAAAARLGPKLSGLLTPFPVYVTVLTVFTHHLQGAAAVAPLLRGVIVGSFSFAIFFVVLGWALEPWRLSGALGAAVLSATAAHGLLLVVLSRNRRRF